MNAFGAGWRPPHAYVPGRTKRHSEDLFDPLKYEPAEVTAKSIVGSNAWSFGLAFLREGYFWEAHELLESIWLASPPNSAEKCMVQGLIQLANAALKSRMKRPQAAERLRLLSDDLVDEAWNRGRGPVLGIDRQDHETLCTIVHNICISDE